MKYQTRIKNLRLVALFAATVWVIFCRLRAAVALVLLAIMVAPNFAQESPKMVGKEPTAERSDVPQTPAAKPDSQINVNWFYGSYVPKDVPLEPMDGAGRFKFVYPPDLHDVGHLH